MGKMIGVFLPSCAAINLLISSGMVSPVVSNLPGYLNAQSCNAKPSRFRELPSGTNMLDVVVGQCVVVEYHGPVGGKIKKCRSLSFSENTASWHIESSLLVSRLFRTIRAPVKSTAYKAKIQGGSIGTKSGHLRPGFHIRSVL